MKEEKYAKKITKKQSTKSKETKDSVSPKETKSKVDAKASMPNKTANKSAVQSTKAPDYNAAMAMVNEDKKRRAQKKKKQAIATGVVAGAVVVTAIVVPAVYFTRSVDLNISIPNIQDSQQYELSVKRGYKIGDLQPKEIEGYTFEGFYKDANLTERYSDDDKITKDITIYAKYTANVYAITFPSSPYFTIAGEDIENNKAYAEYDSSYSFRVKLSAGYTESDIHVYLGETELIPVDGAYTITIKGDSTINITGVEINTYSVVYYDEDAETIIHSEEVDYNTASTYTDTPEKPADNTYTYTFSGWVYYDSGEPITDELTHVINNIKVKASYTATYIEYSIGNIPTQVTIQKGSETLTSSDTLHYGDTVDISYTPTTGYDMASFKVSGATLVSGDTYRVTGNLTVTYTETIQVYTITIESNNTSYGTVDEATLSIPYGTTYQVEGNDLVFSNGARVTPTPASSDAQYTYTFTGWSETSGTITGEETLTAIFAREYVEYSINNPYTQVTIKRDGETLTSESTIHYGDELEITYTPTEGYEMTTFTVTGADRVDETDTYTVTGNLVVAYAEKAVVNFSDFTIENGMVTGYSGTATNVIVPATYSLGNKVELKEFNITSAFLENPTANPDQLVAMYMGDFYVTPNNGERSELMNMYEFMTSYTQTLTEESFPLKIEQTYNTTIDSIEDESGMAILTVLPDIEQELGRILSGTLTYTDASSETGESEYTFDSGTSLMNWLMSVAPDEESALALFPMTLAFNPIVYGEIIEGTDYAITAISESAFAGNTTIESINLPDSITSIPSYAFSGCENLKSVNIPKNVTTLGFSIFSGANVLETVKYEATNCTNFGIFNSYTSSYMTPFYGINPNAAIVISSNVEYIPDDFLYSASSNGTMSTPSPTPIKELIFEENSQLKSIGSRAFYRSNFLTEITIPSSVTDIGESAFSDCSNLTTVTFGENSLLNNIENYVFQNCSKLTSVNISSSVKSIGTNAFQNCNSLTNVYYGGDINDWASILFVGSSANPLSYGAHLYLNGDTSTLITEINIDRATNISDFAFIGWDRLVKVTIGDQVTNIGYQTFYQCTSLTTVQFGENSQIANIGDYAFYDCSDLISISIPSSMTSIGNYTFSGCIRLISVTIPVNVTIIGDYAFRDCNTLTNIYYGGDINDWVGISFANNYANPLYYGENLYLNGNTTTPVTEINIDTATIIRDYAFNGWERLRKVIIGDQVINIGQYVFRECNALETVEFENTENWRVLTGTSSSPYVILLSESLSDPTTVVNYLTSEYSSNTWARIEDALPFVISNGTILGYKGNESIVEIPTTYSVVNGVAIVGDDIKITSIGSRAFANNSTITSVTIPENVSTIGNYAFQSCINLSTVQFEENSQLYSIGAYAFQSCSKLSDFTILSSVRSIGNYAFDNCSTLSNITIPEGLTSLGTSAFNGCTGLTEINFNATNLSDFSDNNNLFYNAGQNSTGIVVNIGANVTRIPAYIFYPKNYSFSLNITSVNFEEGTQCAEIGDYAFCNCSSLASITIPSSVTSIGNYAFDDCNSLINVYYGGDINDWVGISFGSGSANPLSNGANLYLDGDITSPVTEINIDRATSIGEYSFYDWDKLTKVTIGDQVISMGSNAFYICNGLKEINFNAANMPNLARDNNVFAYTGNDTVLNIGADVTRIPAYLFCPYTTNSNSSPNIVSVNFVENSQCTEIGSYAFYGCSSLASITIPSSVTSVGNYAFRDCTGLVEINFNARNMSNLSRDNNVFSNVGKSSEGIVVNIGSNVTRIPAYLFYSSSTNIISLNFAEGSQCTEIGTYAFRNCSSLASITIPSSVTNVGNYAFYDCTGLTEINFDATNMSDLSSNNYVFAYAGNDSSGTVVNVGTHVTRIPAYLFCPGSSSYSPNIKSVNFSEGSQCTEIGSYAFYRCNSLANLAIPESLTTIGSRAFYECTGLTEINFDATNMSDLSSNNYVFAYAGKEDTGIVVNIGTNVTRIPAYLFSPGSSTYSPNIISVNFEEGSQCTEIGNYAFQYCSSLTSIIIPSSVTSIGNYTFQGCSSLTGITIPEGVNNIGSGAFYGCSSLTSIILPEELTSIASTMFYNCSKLSSVNLPERATSIGSSAFYGCSSLTDIAIPEGVNNIGSSAFYGCSNLTSITIPEGVTSIGSNVFYNCSKLSSIELPEKVTSIGSSAFYGCSSLRSITIPEEVSTISSSAFYDCTGLVEINFNARNMSNLSRDNNVFSNVGKSSEGIVVNIGSNVTRIPACLFYSSSTNSSYSPNIISLNYADDSQCTEIGTYAFRNCSSLASITIPSSVTNVGNYAFYDCTGLTEINFNSTNMSDLSSNNYVFSRAGENDTGITVNIGANVTRIPAYLFYPSYSSYSPNIVSVNFEENSQCTEIGDYAFRDCISLTNITIPENVISIGNGAFWDCTGLTEINFNATNMSDLSSGNYVFYNAGKNATGIAVNIGANVTRIPAYLFNPYSSTTSPNIISVDFAKGSQCTEIGDYAFRDCSSLTSITIPEGVTSIGQYAFYNCTGLLEINYNATNVTDLSDSNYVFANAGNSSTGVAVNIGANVAQIPAYLFCPNRTDSSYTPNIVSINFAEDCQCTKIGNYAFYECTGLTEINFNATNMSDLSSNNYVFYNAGQNSTGITVNIGANVTRIPAYLFDPYTTNSNRSPDIVSVNFVENSQCTEIGSCAFYGCSSLTSITIPESVSSIGNYAFSNCTGLTEINFNATNMSDLSSGNRVFYNAGKNNTGIVVNIGANVTRIPAYLFCPYSANSSYSPNIKSLNFAEGSQCTEIGTYAFSRCSSLTNITIPSSVTSIRESVFWGCSIFADVYYGGDINDWVTISFEDFTANPLFYGTNLYLNGDTTTPLSGEINIDRATSIGAYSLYGLDGLTKVTIGDQVTSIGSSAFSSCSSLVEVVNLSSLTFNVGDYGTSTDDNPILEIFTEEMESQLININGNIYKDYNGERYFIKNIDGSNEIEIDSSATQIYQYAFYFRSDITSVTIPSSVTSIGEYAFESCNSLTSITIPSSVTSIGEMAFYRCSSLADVYYGGDINDWVSISFGNAYANPLYYAENLYLNGDTTTPVTEINIDTATSIGAYSLYSYEKLTKVTLGDQVTSIETYAFRNCSSLTTVTFGENSQLESIGDYAFSGCSSLTNITIPSSVTSIGNYAFSGCSSLQYNIYEGGLYLGNTENPFMLLVDTETTDMTEFTIHLECKIIHSNAFESCSSLTSITIPENVTSIGWAAFSDCSSLTSVTFENTSRWYRTTSSTATSGTSVTVTDPTQNATYLKSIYSNYYWKRNA